MDCCAEESSPGVPRRPAGPGEEVLTAGAFGERATERGLAFSCCSDEMGDEAFGEMEWGGPSASTLVTAMPVLEEAGRLGSDADKLRCTSAGCAFGQG